MMMGTSRLFKAVTKYWPTPGITKMLSMKIEPVIPNAKVTGKEVMMGIEHCGQCGATLSAILIVLLPEPS